MCEYCSRRGKKYLARFLVSLNDGKDTKGLNLAMRGNNHTIIENGKPIYAGPETNEDGEIISPAKTDKFINYLQAIEWDRFSNRHNTIAIQIYYCPFCGRKL